ncbi:MAG: hypothetical protein Q9M09_06200 [Mariprofundaceae bacterium]|nr:hypothetical protein [Mariprofundaceae bacterium]
MQVSAILITVAVSPVSINTLRQEVRRANQQALMTHDRMRVDAAGKLALNEAQINGRQSRLMALTLFRWMV